MPALPLGFIEAESIDSQFHISSLTNANATKDSHARGLTLVACRTAKTYGMPVEVAVGCHHPTRSSRHQKSAMKRILPTLPLALLLAALPALSQPSPSMTAHFIKVGQAHATWLEFSCGRCLI
jgi:hypothetical protein